MSTDDGSLPNDPFDDALNVESRFYDNGYSEGLKDGAEAGLIEGRAFGLQKGFEKFRESGKLAGKSIVWANRLPTAKSQLQSSATSSTPSQQALAPLPNNARLEKNINSLYSLVDPRMLSTENSDAAVQDFDDRLRRAQGKARVVERVISGPRIEESKTEGDGSF